ncbi:MAG: glycoside hydrolase family 9 protein [Oscillospiraceae bacterium]|nr:glycoside hydrolase family 9 protein [Oscillospiraceae bacterium]
MSGKIAHNQLGYITNMPKTAVFIGAADSFRIVDIRTGRTVFSGIPGAPVQDEASNDTVSVIDFSTFNLEGDYYIKVGRNKSHLFTISREPYKGLLKGLLKSFYYNRCGTALDKRYAGEYERGLCHSELVPLFENPSVKLDVSGGWHDSGGYGRYSVCTSITLGHLLYAYSLFPESFSFSTGIPGGKERQPDVLTECRTGLDWLLKMQARDGGVHHKVSPMKYTPMVMPENDPSRQYVFPVSHQATACFCAVTALASRIYKPFDETYSKKLFQASVNAWIWLTNEPVFKPFENPPTFEKSLAGDFYDDNINDDIFWAVCELYETTGEEAFHGKLRELAERVDATNFCNRDNGGFGAMCYLLGSRPRDELIEQHLQVQLRMKADSLYSLSKKSGYGTAKSPDDYPVGSNMYAMTDSMTLILAYKIFDCRDYIETAYEQLGYILGKNPMGVCYVTGFGGEPVMHPYHRPSEADEVNDPVPGMLVCGPNNHLQDDFTIWNIPKEAPPAKCYYDISHSVSTNESTIYCNSAAVFVTSCFEDFGRKESEKNKKG